MIFLSHSQLGKVDVILPQKKKLTTVHYVTSIHLPRPTWVECCLFSVYLHFTFACSTSIHTWLFFSGVCRNGTTAMLSIDVLWLRLVLGLCYIGMVYVCVVCTCSNRLCEITYWKLHYTKTILCIQKTWHGVEFQTHKIPRNSEIGEDEITSGTIIIEF